MANVLTLNKKLQLTYPDGFSEMDENEKKGLSLLSADGSYQFLKDPGRHMIISTGWKKAGFLASLFLGENDMAKKMEAKIGKAMQPFGYSLTGFQSRELVGRTAQGFRYRYMAQGTEMTGESYVLKMDKILYYFHLYTRTELEKENLKVWEEILKSLAPLH